MAGAGQSVGQPRGAYHATRYWCRQAADSPNVEGINATFWCRNNLADNLITLFCGAYYSWNPRPLTSFADVEDYEGFDHKVFPIMHDWQALFRDAYPDDLRREQGPLVVNGYYLWGERHGEPVAPTVPVANTRLGHDYLGEG